MTAAPARSAALIAFVAESPVAREPIADAVATFAAALPDGSEVLDAGAGTRPYRSLLAHCRYTSHDWAASPHVEASASAIVADIGELPVPDAHFDAVLVTEVLEHVARPEAVLAELLRVLRPGGRILLTVPFVGELHEEPHDYFRYTSHGLRSLLTAAGFADVEVDPLTGWFTTLASVLRHQGLATTAPDRRPGVRARVVAAAFRLLSRVVHRISPAFDRNLDQRRALPLGWRAQARRPEVPRP